MAIEILPNSAWGNAARVLATNTSDVALADQVGIENVTGGPRYLSYAGAGTGNLRVVYVNKSGGIQYDRVVIAKASNHLGHFVRLRDWLTYPSTTAPAFTDDPFNEPLVGPRGEDFVYSAGLSASLQAVGLELDSGAGGSYSKVVHQVFFSTAFTLSDVRGVTRTRLPKFSRYAIKRKSYQVREEVQIVAIGLTRAQAQAFQQLYRLREEPLYIYDSQGIQIREKLLYGLVQSYQVGVPFHDLHTLTINFVVLEYWL